jgi:hypothetical protein
MPDNSNPHPRRRAWLITLGCGVLLILVGLAMDLWTSVNVSAGAAVPLALLLVLVGRRAAGLDTHIGIKTRRRR